MTNENFEAVKIEPGMAGRMAERLAGPPNIQPELRQRFYAAVEHLLSCDEESLLDGVNQNFGEMREMADACLAAAQWAKDAAELYEALAARIVIVTMRAVSSPHAEGRSAKERIRRRAASTPSGRRALKQGRPEKGAGNKAACEAVR